MDLQFDASWAPVTTNEVARASGEFKAHAAEMSVECRQCRRAISDHYYTVKGDTMCSACCRRRVLPFPGGSRAGRVMRAVALGALAAASGTALHFAILILTGYPVGVLTLIVGFLVGKAVDTGARHRGGIPYQILAMGITFSAAALTSLPSVVPGFASQAAAWGLADAGVVVETRAMTFSRWALPPEAAVTAPDAPPAAPGLIGIVGATLALFGLAALTAIQSTGPVGLAFLSLALIVAWLINLKPRIQIDGPHAVLHAETAPA